MFQLIHLWSPCPHLFFSTSFLPTFCTTPTHSTVFKGEFIQIELEYVGGIIFHACSYVFNRYTSLTILCLQHPNQLTGTESLSFPYKRNICICPRMSSGLQPSVYGLDRTMSSKLCVGCTTPEGPTWTDGALRDHSVFSCLSHHLSPEHWCCSTESECNHYISLLRCPGTTIQALYGVVMI